MTTWIALLRGINVGGRNKLPMTELVNVLQGLHLHNVRTYVQSGNAVFQAARTLDPALLEERIAAAIEQRRGFRPRVIILSKDALHDAMASNPYPQADASPTSLHLFFLGAAPAAPDLALLAAAQKPTEQLFLADRVVYLYAPDGIGRSRLAGALERALGVAATARNWRTLLKLEALAETL